MSRSARDTEDAIAEFRLGDNVSHLLRRAHFRAENLFAARLESSGLTPRQKALLIAAYQEPGSTLRSLAEAIVLDRQSTAEMADRLVRRGLLERRRSTSDARAYAVWVTEAGVALLSSVMQEDALVSEDILAPLPPEYRPLFLKCLHLMVDENDSKGPIDNS
jgi:DNA-binding MarR family transcriptional regulator